MLFFDLSMLASDDDRGKFEALYIAYKNLMYHVAYGYLKNEQQAEDAVQESFVKILERFHKFNEISCPQTKSYCVIVCRNISLNMLARDKQFNHKQVYFEDMLLDVADQTQVEQEIMQKAGLEQITECVTQLPPIYRDVFGLYYGDEIPLKEIAKSLDVSLETVKKRLQRARQMLAEALRKGGVTSEV